MYFSRNEVPSHRWVLSTFNQRSFLRVHNSTGLIEGLVNKGYLEIFNIRPLIQLVTQESKDSRQEGTSGNIKPDSFQDGPVPTKLNIGQRFQYLRREDSNDLDHNNQYSLNGANASNFDEYRYSRQIDRTDSLLGGFNVQDSSELPLHEPTGEKTRKTYDFTS